MSPEARENDWRLRAMDRLAGIHLNRLGVAALVGLLTLISLVLRIQQLGFHFWIDEGISVGIASHPLSELPHLLREDGSPPLYYFLLHVWMQIFGHSEKATHELSLLFALITVPVSYLSGSSLWGRRTGAYCAVLAAGLPFITSYAQETRMYSLVVLLSVIVATAFLHTFVYRRRAWLPVFAVSLVGTLYTHNWGLFMGVMAFVAFLVCVRLTPRVERRPLVRDGVLAFGITALLYLPWVPTLFYQAKHTGAPWALSPILWSFSQGAYFITGGRGAAVAILLGAGAGLLAIRNRGIVDQRTRIAIACLSVLGVGTVVVAWLYAKHTPAWAFRYLAVVIGPLLLLAGLGLARAAKLGLVALLLVSCFWILDPHTNLLDAKSNVASAAAKIATSDNANTWVISTQPEQVPTLSYYLPKVTHFETPIGPVPDPRVMDWRNALEHFEHGSVHHTLVPMLRKLKPGQRLALVEPVRFTKEPRWMDLIYTNSYFWARYLKRDSHLKLIGVFAPYAFEVGLPVRISLYSVQSAGT
ncbi:MAG TPA: glycosyltransferase family 39 protein [Solirubrobacteraceae bacterium]